MRWKLVCFLALWCGCNLSDTASRPEPSNNANGTNNTNNQTTTACDPTCLNGTCVDGVCDCETGYVGPSCGSCDTNFQDHDDDGVCAPSCSTDDCGNGACEDSSGSIVCDCGEAYMGESCEQCADGFQDYDDDGVCSPTCATAMLDCSPHGSCDDAGGTAQCACPVGSEGTEGTECEIVAPHAFGDDWTPYGEASIDPMGAFFSKEAVCDVLSGVTGTYSLASPEIIGPLKGRISYDANPIECPGAICYPGAEPPVLRINDRAFVDLGDRNLPNRTFGEQEFCLGDRFMGDVELDLLPRQTPGRYYCDDAFGDYQGLGRVGELSFLRADSDECPDRGFALNHDFEQPRTDANIPGWVRDGFDVVELSDTLQGSELHLRAESGCASGTIRSLINIPASDSGQAVRFRYRASGAPFVEAIIAGTTHVLPDWIASSSRTQEYCIPSHFSGTVQPISFRFRSSCGAPALRELFVDDIEIVDSDACDVQNGLSNGSFDRGGLGWVEKSNRPAIFEYLTVNGDNLVRIDAESQCANPSVEQPVYLPKDGSLNAIDVTYQLRRDDGRAAIAFLGDHHYEAIENDLPITGDLIATQTICLPKQAFGFAGTFAIRILKRSSPIDCDEPLPTPILLSDVKFRDAEECQ